MSETLKQSFKWLIHAEMASAT